MMEQNEHQITQELSTFITEGMNGWQAGFTIGVQTFYLQPVSANQGDEEDTEEKAKWYQKNLETAFGKIISKSPSGVDVLVEALKRIEKICLRDAVGIEPMQKHFRDIYELATTTLAQYNAVEPEKDFDPMKLPDEYKTDDPIKAAVYWGWYHGLVNGHTHKFTWQEYQKTHPSQSPPTPIDREQEGERTKKEIADFLNWCSHLAWFDNDTQLWNTHDESLDPFRYTTDEMMQEYISCDKDSEKFENKHSQ